MKTNPRVALVTGGNRGIGLEVCRQLAQRGYKVLLGTRERAKGEAAARTISGDVDVIVVDVAEPEAAQGVADEVQTRYAQLDVLVNNAGIHYDSLSWLDRHRHGWQRRAAGGRRRGQRSLGGGPAGRWTFRWILSRWKTNPLVNNAEESSGFFQRANVQTCADIPAPGKPRLSANSLGTLPGVAIKRKGPRLKGSYIFIDFENVQPKDLALLKGRDYKVMIFVGATQAKLPTEFAIAAQALGPSAEYVQIDGSGRNALDFHIAYYLGCASVDSSAGESFVISKDTGFDPLTRHLKAKGVSCRRLSSIGEIPGLREAAIRPTSDPIQRIIANLAKRAAAKPRTVKTLRSSIKHLLGEQGTEEAVNRLVGELERLNAVKITDGKVTYPS